MQKNFKEDVVKKFVLFCITGLVSGLFFFLSCKLVAEDGDSVKGVYALRVASGDVSGWEEEKVGGYKTFKASTMCQDVNGYCKDYIDKGLLEGFQQVIASSSKTATFLITDFVTPEKAAAMYEYWTAKVDDAGNTGTYDAKISILDNDPADGVIAWAHFNRYVLKLVFSGYLDKADASKVALSFVEVFETKIAELK
jgi:hypothetical protein